MVGEEVVTGECKEIHQFQEKGIISPDAMKAVELNAISLGYSADLMMESAGRALADFARRNSPEKIVVLCGKGNNGGDGMVAARYLARDYDVEVWYLDQQPVSPSCERQRRLLGYCDIPLFRFRCRNDLDPLPKRLRDSDLIIDALLGTGAGSGPLREPLDTCVAMANESGTPIISADLPTSGIRATGILAFHRPKIHGSDVADIGIPIEAEVFTGPGEVTLLPSRGTMAHKGEGGRILVIGGGPYQGAPYLAGLGALRAGADIVRIASPVFEPIPDLIYERLDGRAINMDHLSRLIEISRQSDVILCGNGLGDSSHDVVCAVAPHCKKAVFDADALRQPLPRAEETIYTPHAAELTRMTGEIPPSDLAGRGCFVQSAAGGSTILLKGPVDVISDGMRVKFNRTGTPAMTVGGTGDVLSGVTAALFCHLPAFDAATVAAYVNGMAGMAAEKAIGGGLLASDLVNYIPRELFGKGVSNG
jgi:ADP-dependent NAD(P)H-hydrate dehydratase / NAD(P)H-hydrate epimerase